MGFLDYLGVGAGVAILLLMVMLGFIHTRKYHPPPTWTNIGEQLRQFLASLLLFVLIISGCAGAFYLLAGLGWVCVQLLKLLGLLP